MFYRRVFILRAASSSAFAAGTNAGGRTLSPYDVLGVTPTTPFAEVRCRYQELTRHYHPDMPHGNPEKFRDINAAYRLLRARNRERRSEKMDSAGFWNDRDRRVKEDCEEDKRSQERRDRHASSRRRQSFVRELLWLYEGYELGIVLGAAVLVLFIAADRYFLVQRMTREKRARIRAMEEGLPPNMPLVVDDEMLLKYNDHVSQEEIDVDNAMTRESAYYRRATQRRFEDFREFLFVHDTDGVTSRKVTTSRFSVQYIDEGLIPKRCTHVWEFNSEKKDQRYETLVKDVAETLRTTPWAETDAQHIMPLIAKGLALISMNSPDTAKWTFVEYKNNEENGAPLCLMALKNNRFEQHGMCQRVTVAGNSKLSPRLAKKREMDLQSGALTRKNLVQGKTIPLKDLPVPHEYTRL